MKDCSNTVLSLFYLNTLIAYSDDSGGFIIVNQSGACFCHQANTPICIRGIPYSRRYVENLHELTYHCGCLPIGLHTAIAPLNPPSSIFP
jgi:hypothetical protein